MGAGIIDYIYEAAYSKCQRLDVAWLQQVDVNRNTCSSFCGHTGISKCTVGFTVFWNCSCSSGQNVPGHVESEGSFARSTLPCHDLLQCSPQIHFPFLQDIFYSYISLLRPLALRNLFTPAFRRKLCKLRTFNMPHACCISIPFNLPWLNYLNSIRW